MNRKVYLGLVLVPLLVFCSKEKEPVRDVGGGQASDLKSTTGISEFKADINLYSINTYLLSNNAMQGFNFDSDGSIWYTQSADGGLKHQINLVKSPVNKGPDVLTSNMDVMKLHYFGHGTNTAIEEVGEDRYLWVGAYASARADGTYWGDRVIGRVKYVKNRTVKTNECDEYYYMGTSYDELHPSIDAENDLLTINYNDPTNSSFRCFVIYKLSEAKKAAMINANISCTNGFEVNNPNSLVNKTYTVYCRDLTTLTPVANVKFRKTGYGAAGAKYYDWQGYDVHKDKLYYFEGQSNYNLNGSTNWSGESQSFVTVFDFKGKVVEERTRVDFVANRDVLSQIGVTQLGAMEAEGIKVYKGNLYLGYTSRGITQEDTKHYQNIFKFNTSNK
ncbi:hypothetical protein [Sphingobacterium faecale]|uniref:Uncharacterized protein n=1 Tax=Sphingobacterium faecale TaxID=2803775 RepID=A0ABS1QYW8_9SPHI|nr:hypothetical protein [Sphingobacterium faecale]MBL1407627.1 hypothetical protein [Sphingobacterium faecale]